MAKEEAAPVRGNGEGASGTREVDPEAGRDVEARIRRAAASAAQAAEQRAAEEILALEEDLERAKEEAQRAKRKSAQAANAQARKREKELERAKARVEGELAAVRRQLEEARGRAAAAERRVKEIERRGQRGVARELELRLQAIEGRLGEFVDRPTERTAGAVGATATSPEEIDPAPEAETGPAAAGARVISLSDASFEELRAFGMSVTQAKRVLAYRERLEGFESFRDLDRVPGFPRLLLSQIKQRLKR